MKSTILIAIVTTLACSAAFGIGWGLAAHHFQSESAMLQAQMQTQLTVDAMNSAALVKTQVQLDETEEALAAEQQAHKTDNENAQRIADTRVEVTAQTAGFACRQQLEFAKQQIERKGPTPGEQLALALIEAAIK